MSGDRILREQGSRDWRMLPIAIVMWAASLGAHALFAWRMSDGLGTGQVKADAGAGIDVTIIGMEWPVTRILPITVASCAAVAAMIVVSFRLRIRWTGTLTVCVAVACIGSMAAIAFIPRSHGHGDDARDRFGPTHIRLSDGHTAERHHCGWRGRTFHGRRARIRR